MPRLDVDFRSFDKETQKLNNLTNNINSLSPLHQKLVAEIMLLRLLSLLENTIESIFVKIACGANYLDGSVPILLGRANSYQSGLSLFRNYNRTSPRIYLKWTIVKEIKRNVKYVIDHSDTIYSILDQYNINIDEIRRIRNRIAHNNKNSRNKYKYVVMRHYGAYLNFITPGTLLLTKRKTPNLLVQYITTSRVFISDLVKR